MWLFTIYGFFSVSVQVAKNGDKLVQVRTRNRAHLEHLMKRFGLKYKILRLPNRDYRYRIEMSKGIYQTICQGLAQEQTWDNFKNAASTLMNDDPGYISALHQIWSVMHRYQTKLEGEFGGQSSLTFPQKRVGR